MALGTIDEWELTHALRLSKGIYPRLSKAIVHYDFWRVVVSGHGHADFSTDPVLEWIAWCERVDIVTCVVQAGILQARLRRRVPRYLSSRLQALMHARSPHLYSPFGQTRLLGRPEKLAELYEDWSLSCADAGFTNHWQLDTGQTLSIVRMEDPTASANV